MFRCSISVLLMLLIMPAVVFGIDPPAYSDRDNTYSAFKRQINTLYRNAINGDGNSYTTTDTYTDYYGNTQNTTTTVTTKILINNGDYYSSDLHKRIDTNSDVDRYTLKNNIAVGYADRVNTSNYSDVATITRKSDFGQYLPRDCSSDPSCSVKWVKELLFSLYTVSADNADTDICKTGSVDPNIPPDVFSNTGFAALLTSQRNIDKNALCQHDAIKIYHAQRTDQPVNESMYLVPGGDYNNFQTKVWTTKAQRTGFASNYAQWFSTYNEIKGENVDGHIGLAAFSKNAGIIKNENANYTGGNSTSIIVYVP